MDQSDEKLDDIFCSCKQGKAEDLYIRYHELKKIKNNEKWSKLEDDDKLFWIRLAFNIKPDKMPKKKKCKDTELD